MTSKKYAGIGARKTPANILKEMTAIANFLEKYGYILRSGAAPGADSAFELGVQDSSNCEIYLPWPKFASHTSKFSSPTSEALSLAAQYHPRWHSLGDPVKKLMGRNSHQVLGSDLKEPSDFIVCWTPDGKASGGTGQALRIGAANNVAIYNLFNDKDRNDLRALCKNIKVKFLAPKVRKHKHNGCFNGNNCDDCYGCHLQICSVCGGSEGSLTTECPGERMGYEKEQEVYKNGNIDYTLEKGWHDDAPHGTHHWRMALFEGKEPLT